MVRHVPVKRDDAGSIPAPTAIPSAAVVDTFLGIHPDDESCHGPILCVGCVMASEVRKLRAELATVRANLAKIVYGKEWSAGYLQGLEDARKDEE